MASITVYSDPNTGGTTVDGAILHYQASGGYSAARDSAFNYPYPNGESSRIMIFHNAGAYQYFERWGATFDTSAIDDGATINSAIFSMYGTGKSDDGSKSPDFAIYGWSPAADNNISASDGSNAAWGSIYSNAITYSGWSTSGYNDFTFNSTGLAAISKTGITKFGMRHKTYDADNTDPSLSSPQYEGVNFRESEYTGTSNDPKLVIDYSTGGSSTSSRLALLGVG